MIIVYVCLLVYNLTKEYFKIHHKRELSVYVTHKGRNLHENKLIV